MDTPYSLTTAHSLMETAKSVKQTAALVWSTDKIQSELAKMPDSLDKQRKEKALRRSELIYRGISFSIFLLILAIFALSMKQSDELCLLGNSLKSELEEKNSFSLRQSVWDYINDPVLPLLSTKKNGSVIIDGNLLLIGGIELRQFRLDYIDCSIDSGIRTNDSDTITKCLSSTISSAAFGPPNITHFYGTSNPFWGSYSLINGPHNSVYLPKDTQMAAKVVSELQQFNWIDRATKSLVIVVNVFSLSSNQFGQFVKILEHDSGVWSSNTYFAGYKLPDTQFKVTYALYLLVFLVFEAIYIKRVVTSLFLKGVLFTGKLYYFSLSWESLDSLISTTQIVYNAIVISFAARSALIVQNLNILAISQVRDTVELDSLVALNGVIWIAAITVMFLLGVKSFQFFEANSYTAMAFTTIILALPHLGALLTVIMFIWSMLSLLGTVLFCSVSLGFKNWSLAFLTSWDILTGSLSLASMFSTSKILGPIYYILFTLLMSLILLNMFIGVISEFSTRAMVEEPHSESKLSFGEKLKKKFSSCLAYMTHSSIRTLTPSEGVYLLATKTFQRWDLNSFKEEMTSLGIDNLSDTEWDTYFEEYLVIRRERDIVGLKRGDLMTLWNLIEDKIDSLSEEVQEVQDEEKEVPAEESEVGQIDKELI